MDPNPPGLRFGPHTAQVEDVIEQASRLTRPQLESLEASRFLMLLDESGPVVSGEPTAAYAAEEHAWTRIGPIPVAIMQSLDDTALAARLFPQAKDPWQAALDTATWCYRARESVGTAVRAAPGIRTLPSTATRYLRSLDSGYAVDLVEALVVQDWINRSDLDALFLRWRQCQTEDPSNPVSFVMASEIGPARTTGCVLWAGIALGTIAGALGITAIAL